MDAAGTATVRLDGSTTTDPDGNELSYWWLVENELVAERVTPTIQLTPGQYSIQLVVRDPTDSVSSDDVAIIVNRRFIRGDSNGDGQVDVSDAVHILLGLYTDRIRLTCPDAADANDDGALDLSDAIFTLRYLFAGANPPPFSPFPDPGPDPTVDGLHCTGN